MMGSGASRVSNAGQLNSIGIMQEGIARLSISSYTQYRTLP